MRNATSCARIAVTLVCLLFVVLFGTPPAPAGASSSSSGTPPPASSAPETSPFAATGLLAHPGETAEEILLRAHEYDAGAIALVVAGYKMGMGDFPRLVGVSTAWSVLSTRLDSRNAAFLLLLSVQGDAPKNDESAEWLADCEHGRASRLAPFFRQAGIFDIDAECRRLLAFKKQDSAWEKEYRTALSNWPSEKEEKANVNRARRLTAGPLTDEDKAAFARGEFGNMEVFSFYAATTHDVGLEPPDWRADRLLRFIRMRKKEDGRAARALESGAIHALMLRLGADASAGLALARRAHAHDMAAARHMAMNYLNGAAGFPIDASLAEVWLRYGAMAGDARSMDLQAAQLYARGNDGDAWMWARLAAEYGDADIRQRAEALARFIEEDAPQAMASRRETLEYLSKNIKELIRARQEAGTEAGE